MIWSLPPFSGVGLRRGFLVTLSDWSNVIQTKVGEITVLQRRERANVGAGDVCGEVINEWVTSATSDRNVRPIRR